MALQNGTKAPAIKAKTDSGGAFTLSSCKGAWVVLYFYPKDDTSGCTAEACDFRDAMSDLTKRGVTVVGVSPDSPASHDRFKAKYDLNFTLVSDEDHAICEAYDTWKQKSMYGRTYMGVERTTYIINPAGKIVATFEKVKVNGHVDQVSAALTELSA
ncbi:MAG: thioredoxin-dependent thiol peroxidase [Candidatus Kapabacteria bacterium]|nr:thioredoxin-dependent thiol peroxidase [Candidatus Kapabacteria bacterium]